MGLVTAFVHSPGIATNLQFKLIPNTIGTVFGMWLRTLVDTELQNILLTENSHAELSVFLVVVWYTYRNKGTLKFSALLRRFVAEAMVYFLAMVAAQIYVQVSFNLVEVQSPPLFSLCFAMFIHDHYRVNSFHFCEYTVDLTDVIPALRYQLLLPHTKCIWTVRCPTHRPFSMSS